MKKLCTFLLLFVHVVAVKAAVWYVSPTGSGSGTGCGSPAGASSLQTVINGAATGDVVYLLAGTFNLTSSINISKSITLEGAGMGNTTLQSSASALSPFSITANNVTVKNLSLRAFTGSVNLAKGFYIDGKTGISFENIEFKDMPSGQNSEIVNVRNDSGAAGVTFTNCWWHNNTNSNCLTVTRNSSTNAINITVTGCVFASTDDSRGFPAGIYYNQVLGSGTAAANLTISNSLFSCLTAQRGPAIGMFGGNSTLKATFNVSNCTFNGNHNTSTSEGGGAVYVYRSVTANITNCIFDGNDSDHKGGAIYADGSTPTAVDLLVQDCEFSNNVDASGGGAIHLRKPGTTALSTDIVNCLFHHNSSTGGAGALGTESSTYNVNVDRCTFAQNDGTGTTKEAIEANTAGTVLITNSIIWGNPVNGTANKELLEAAGTTGTINNSVFVAANNTGFSGTGNSATDPALNTGYEPTSGTLAGYRVPGSLGGTPGDNVVNDEDGCLSASFNYPQVNPFCVSTADDSGTVPTSGGTAVANVAANDLVNGVPATLGASGNATVETTGTWPTGIALNTNTGAITVVAGVLAPGDYMVTYTLCDKGVPPSCKTGSATVTVSAPVPVTWVDFSAKKVNNSVVLDWTTAQEVKNHFFEVQYSTNGYAWNAVGTVAAQKNSDVVSHYQFTDYPADLAAANLFYRVKQVDTDGQFSFSPIRNLTNGVKNNQIRVYPNPADHTNVLHVSATEGIARIQIYHLNGSLMTTSTVHFTSDTEAEIPLGAFPVGIYLLECTDQQGGTSHQLFKVI
jgi:predicted outer membrane repeat protein